MIGRGKAPATRGRKAISATEEGPSEEQPQQQQDALFVILAQIQATLAQLVAQSAVVQPVLPPVEQPTVVLQVQLAAPEHCLRFTGRSQMVGEPEFLGATHPPTADSARVVEMEHSTSQHATETDGIAAAVQLWTERTRPAAAAVCAAAAAF